MVNNDVLIDLFWLDEDGPPLTCAYKVVNDVAYLVSENFGVLYCYEKEAVRLGLGSDLYTGRSLLVWNCDVDCPLLSAEYAQIYDDLSCDLMDYMDRYDMNHYALELL